jgi:PIN domain nuclease of toxin-antitoxin system
VKVLLDTSIFLWMAGHPERLNSKATALLTAPETDLWLSVASSWEIVIKASIGKLDLGSPPKEFIPKMQAAFNIHPLSISLAHALALQDLRVDAHKDPFDRMLVAQSGQEGMVFLTSDRSLMSFAKKQSIDVLWAAR